MRSSFRSRGRQAKQARQGKATQGEHYATERGTPDGPELIARCAAPDVEPTYNTV